MLRTRYSTTTAALLGMLFTSIAPFAYAEGPADLVPADSLAYAGWRQVINDENESIVDALPALMRAFDADDDEIAEAEQAMTLVKMLGRATGAVALLDFVTEDRDLMPALAAVIDAGPDAEAIAVGIRRVANKGRDEPGETINLGGLDFQYLHRNDPIFMRVIDNRVIIAVSKSAAERIAKHLQSGGSSLADSDGYRKASQNAGISTTDTELSLFARLPALLDILKRVAAEEGDPMPPKVEKALKALGVTRLDDLLVHFGQSDGATSSRVFLGFHGPRTGLLKLWDQQPLTPDDFKHIPRDAYWAAATNLDLRGLWEEALRVAEAIEPDAPAQMEGVVAMASGVLGFSITDDLLPAFGDTWMIFDAPDHGGFLITGTALVVEVKDADALRGIFGRILQIATPLAAQEDVNIAARSIEHNGHAIHYLLVPGLPIPVAPAAAFVEGRVVCGLNPQVVKVVLNRWDTASAADSILAEPDVAAIHDQLPQPVHSFFYTDMHYAVRSSYWLTSLVMTAFASLGASESPEMDPALLPTLPETLANVRNAVAVCSVGDDGVRYVSEGSASVVMLPQADVAVIALLISVLLPSLSRARGLAKRAVSSSNLRGIAMGCHIYANDYNEAFPPSFEHLVGGGYITPEMLISPRGDLKELPQSQIAELQARGDLSADSPKGGILPTSYVLITEQTWNSDTRNVLAYETPLDDEGTNVAFLDGHVEWMKLPQFREALRKTYERLDRLDELPAEFR